MAIALVLAGMTAGSGALLRSGIVLACLASVLHLAMPVMGKKKTRDIPRASLQEAGASLYKVDAIFTAKGLLAPTPNEH